MALTDERIAELRDEACKIAPLHRSAATPFARSVEAEVRRQDEPLTDEQSHALLHRMADESDKWAEGLSYEPTREQVSGWCVAFLMRELPAHGIKGKEAGNVV